MSLRGPAGGGGDGYEALGASHCCPPHQSSQTGELPSWRCSEQGSEHNASTHTSTDLLKKFKLRSLFNHTLVVKPATKKREKSNFYLSSSSPLHSLHSTRCGHHQHPPHSKPNVGDSVRSLGLLLPGPSAAYHLWESPLLCPEHQGCHVRLGGTCFTWSS